MQVEPYVIVRENKDDAESTPNHYHAAMPKDSDSELVRAAKIGGLVLGYMAVTVFAIWMSEQE